MLAVWQNVEGTGHTTWNKLRAYQAAPAVMIQCPEGYGEASLGDQHCRAAGPDSNLVVPL